MRNSILLIAAFLMLSACGGNKTAQAVADSDSLTTDSVTVPDDGKHNAEAISQRVDMIYSCYKNPKYDEYGMRLLQRINLDSLYCTREYKKLYEQAMELTDEDDILLDYDHWTNSQDDNEFTYQIGRISMPTDSTAIVQVDAKNFGNEYSITLGLLFEQGDWYVDDFLSSDGKDGEKAYFQNYIRERIKEKAEELSLDNYAE